MAEATANDKDTEMVDALEKVIVTLCSFLCCLHSDENLHDEKHYWQVPVAVHTRCGSQLAYAVADSVHLSCLQVL